MTLLALLVIGPVAFLLAAHRERPGAALGTSLGLAVPAALNLGFPEPGTGAAGRRR